MSRAISAINAMPHGFVVKPTKQTRRAARRAKAKAAKKVKR